jgi:hypothetical protein
MFTLRVRLRALGPTGKTGRARTVTALIDPERVETSVDAGLARSLACVVIRGRRRADDRTCLAIDAVPSSTGESTVLAGIEDLGPVREREGLPIRVHIGRDALRFVRGPMPRFSVTDENGRELIREDVDAVTRKALDGLRRRPHELAGFAGTTDMGD